MPPTRRTPYTAISVTTDARSALRATALQLQAKVGRQLSLSAVLTAVVRVASQHPDELASALEHDPGTEGDHQ